MHEMRTLRKKSSKRASLAKKTVPRSDSLAGDVTIADFANATTTHARLPKASANILEVSKDAAVEGDIANSWSDLDNTQETAPHTMEDLGKCISTLQTRRRKGKLPEEASQDQGTEYPLDVWFLISEYVRPEAVGKFALICRNSYYVTTTGKFWFHLYKYHYRFVVGLPERLQPQCMVRTHSLRACVIRTLHFTYFPLRKEADAALYLRQEHPHSLTRRQCCLMWHKEVKLRWYFFFKLREVTTKKNTSLPGRSYSNYKKTEFLETWKDVSINPEEGCKVLRVTCQKYCMLPPVIGLILQAVSLNLMPGFKDHRLQLSFGTSSLLSTLTAQAILTDVIDYKILDWWNPHYPHEDRVHTIELPQIDSWD